MKTVRLYAITLYLLNHGRTSAAELADYFEVSTRTIQRDIDSLCLAGIPVIATAGAMGGYELSDRYQLDKNFATPKDYACLLTALHGLISATCDPKAKQLLEKVLPLSESAETGMILDFSILREGDENILQLLQTAIAKKHAVTFSYTNNNNQTRLHCVEPIAVLYRWYAWYLLAYSMEKNDYRTYKMVRMREVALTSQPFTQEHAAADVILKEKDRNDSRQYTQILLKCQESAKMRVIEYLKGTVLATNPDGSLLIKAAVVENEHLWLGTLLALGDAVEILSPEHVRTRLFTSAEKIVALYSKEL